MISHKKIVGYNTGKKGVKCMICGYYYFKDKLIINRMFVMIVMTFL